MKIVWSLILCFLLSSFQVHAFEQFEEEVYFRRSVGVDKATTIAHFQFTTRWLQNLSGSNNFRWKHFNLFPKALGQIVDRFNVQELSLTFSKGVWRDKEWGIPFVPAPSGLEVSAVLQNDLVRTAYGNETAWTVASRELAGMFCASINYLDEKHTVPPVRSLVGANINVTNNRMAAVYGQLPKEASCTENLTPWLKLSPCRAEEGLGRLLVPKLIYSSRHHTMRTHFQKVCYDKVSQSAGDTLKYGAWSNCSNPVAELVQTLTLVFDQNLNEGPFQFLQGEMKSTKPGRFPFCRVAKHSLAYVERVPTQDEHSGSTHSFVDQDVYRIGDVEILKFDLFNAAALVDKAVIEAGSSTVKPSRVTIKRLPTGSGPLAGGISTIIKNTFKQNTEIRLLEMIPNYIRVKPSTLSIMTGSRKWSQSEVSAAVDFYLPKLDGTVGTIEFVLFADPMDIVVIHYEYEKLFQNIDAFPPSPNTGFDIPAVMLVYKDDSDEKNSKPAVTSPLLSRLPYSNETPLRTYSNQLLVMMPMQDFSMPFNVITLTSTILALYFGSIVNILARRRAD